MAFKSKELNDLCARLQKIADRLKADKNSHGFIVERGIGLMRHQFTVLYESLDWARETIKHYERD